MTRRVTIQRSNTTHKDNKDPGKAKNQLWDTYIKKTSIFKGDTTDYLHFME